MVARKRRDVGRLAHGIGEEARGYVHVRSAQPDLVLDRRVALQARDRHEIHEQYRELRELGHLGLDEDGRLRRIDADRQIVERHLDDVGADAAMIGDRVGQSLQVGEQDETSARSCSSSRAFSDPA
jgi:hypothetical protein